MRLIYAGKVSGYAVRCHGPDAIDQTVTVKGKTVHFDFDEMAGPLVTDKHGSPLKRQPIAETDPFWPPFNAWLAEYRAKQAEAGSRTASQAPGKDALASDLNQTSANRPEKPE